MCKASTALLLTCGLPEISIEFKGSGLATPDRIGLSPCTADTFSRRRPPYVHTSTGICLLTQVSSHGPQKTSKTPPSGVRSARLPLLLLQTANLGGRPSGVHGSIWNRPAKGKASEVYRRTLGCPARWWRRNATEHCSRVSMVQPHASPRATRQSAKLSKVQEPRDPTDSQTSMASSY